MLYCYKFKCRCNFYMLSLPYKEMFKDEVDVCMLTYLCSSRSKAIKSALYFPYGTAFRSNLLLSPIDTVSAKSLKGLNCNCKPKHPASSSTWFLMEMLCITQFEVTSNGVEFKRSRLCCDPDP